MSFEITSSKAQTLEFNLSDSASVNMLNEVQDLAHQSIRAIEEHPIKTFTYFGMAAAALYFSKKGFDLARETPLDRQLLKRLTGQPITWPSSRFDSDLPHYLFNDELRKEVPAVINTDFEATFKVGRFSRIDKTAIIGRDVVIGKNVRIGPFVEIGHGAVIDDDVSIAAGTKIGDGSYIAKGTQLGKDVEIGKNVKFSKPLSSQDKTEIKDFTAIGDNCLLGPSCFLGTKVGVGPNCELGEKVAIYDFSLLHEGVKIGSSTVLRREVFIGEMSTIGEFAQLGHRTMVGRNVIIGDRVSTWGLRHRETRSIERGVIIEEGCAIGNSSNIQSRIGRNTLIGPFSTIMGKVGANVYSEANVSIGINASIGDNARLGARTQVAHGIDYPIRLPAGTVLKPNSVYPERRI